jgi:hypothetical protein
MTEEYTPKDLSDPKQVAKAIKKGKDKDERREDALRGIMGTPEGRMWIHGLLEQCHPFATAFSTDALRMAHNCGEANIGLQLIAELHACSTELYLIMMKENSGI